MFLIYYIFFICVVYKGLGDIVVFFLEYLFNKSFVGIGELVCSEWVF